MWFWRRQKKDEDQTEESSTKRAYRDVIRRSAAMVSDRRARRMAKKHKLRVINVTWEDTGRYKLSCVGPNISDMTIQVQHEGQLTCMPVIRFSNFSDKTADLKLSDFSVLVGNERGEALRSVNLREYLNNLRSYLSDPSSWTGEQTSLLAERDSHVLVSAQACFLPVPKKGIAEFNPVLFNYQSHSGSPAVLTILATREGTSATIIDNVRDGFSAGRTWGQRLFFNQNSERASLTGERLSDFAEREVGSTSDGDQEGLNMVLLIQVPLKQSEPSYDESVCCSAMAPVMRCCSGVSNVEAAVIGHGDVEGPFTEIDGVPIERDPRFPIRVTVQFYKATSNGVVAEEDLKEIAEEIDQVYRDADFVGSLVTSSTDRPTEYDGDKTEPPDWWQGFWQRHEANTGQTREEALVMLRKLRGPKWQPNNDRELQRALREVR